jgi:hypothetical protein
MGIFTHEIDLLDVFQFQQCHIDFSSVNDTAETVYAVSMTPLKL